MFLNGLKMSKRNSADGTAKFQRQHSRMMITVGSMLMPLLVLVLCSGLTAEVSGQESDVSDVRYLSGEPDYKSVNLTWEVGALEADEAEEAGSKRKPSAAKGRRGRASRSFNVYYCELQSWGPHRCRSKVLTDDSESSGSSKQYTMTVKNLRMATKYSFHVKTQPRRGDQKASGRAEEEFDVNAVAPGQTVIIPTKGFSAHATQCLPHASEIEVQTGPYFGGRIGSENGVCGIQGDQNSPQESYIMRIDHDECGSRVNPADLTVESYITVQENLGILTHSTRRFVVVCTFQPDTLTVRARLALPGKGKGGAAPVPMSEWWPTGASGRNGRVRQFKMVDKTSLVLKGSDEEEVEDILPATVKEVEKSQFEAGLPEEDGKDEVVQGSSEKAVLSSKENEVAESKTVRKRTDKGEALRDAKFARLFESKLAPGVEKDSGVSELTTGIGAEEQFSARSIEGGSDRSMDLPSLFISASLAVIMIGAFIYVLQKEYKKQRIIQQHHQQMQRPPPNRMASF
ncbi:uncharacterized protein LOC129744976 [Uranotaenia lowii]|uniref:uncharacterized protein LOC129744976 n=1 Tax=Uranotaenia lowii TaxID=190385 RepID=UPI002478798E|nr:uncharacterized protein LOC129744976 [Uranotaenia lowii]